MTFYSPCQYVQDYYDVPAFVGGQVIVDGRPGVISEDRGNYIGVKFDDAADGVIVNCHPTWRVTYIAYDPGHEPKREKSCN